MNLFKVFNYSKCILQSFYTCQPACSSTRELMIPPLEFRHFSSLQKGCSSVVLSNVKSFTPLLIPSNGLKSKGSLQLRCKNCYFERRDGDMYVFCSSYGRHKQKLRSKRSRKYYWTLSYAFMSKIRPY